MRFFYKDRPVDLAGWRDVIRRRKENHWAEGCSATLLARAWLDADGAPPAVAKAISPVFTNLTLSEGFVEHETRPPGQGGSSATDLLAPGTSGDVPVVLAVEGKVDEGFDHRIGCWV